MNVLTPTPVAALPSLDGGFRINILIVDDSVETLIALDAILAGVDRNIVTVHSGEEALKYLLHHDVGVIVLDVKLSGMNGYETAALIRERDKTRDIPIIFLTAYNKDDADVLRGYSYGAADYIFKPVVPEILKSKVDVFVELAKRADALRRKNDELEMAERELLRTKAAMSLIKHAPDALFVSDLNARILQANDAACRLLGLEPDELMQQSLARFLSPEESAQFTAALRDVVQHGVSRNVKLNPRSANGDVTPTTLNATAWRDADGRMIGAIGILRDMRAFEQVVQDLERSKNELQEKINELEKFEEAVVGRELKMIQLERELGRMRGRREELLGENEPLV
jgi:PAS domain S-box-containing protein